MCELNRKCVSFFRFSLEVKRNSFYIFEFTMICSTKLRSKTSVYNRFDVLFDETDSGSKIHAMLSLSSCTYVVYRWLTVRIFCIVLNKFSCVDAMSFSII